MLDELPDLLAGLPKDSDSYTSLIKAKSSVCLLRAENKALKQKLADCKETLRSIKENAADRSQA